MFIRKIDNPADVLPLVKATMPEEVYESAASVLGKSIPERSS